MNLFREIRVNASEKLIQKKQTLPPEQSTAPTPIYKADLLLKPDSKQVLLNQIRLLFPESVVNSLYLPVIKRFAEAVQSLPIGSKESVLQFGDLFGYGLSRAKHTLRFALEALFPNQNNFNSIYSNTAKEHLKNKRTALELYAVFTAALFLDTYQLMTEHRVSLYDESEKLLPKVWNPLCNLMVEEKRAVSYRFQKLDQYSPYLPSLVNGALVISILSGSSETKQGFMQLTEDLELFEYWLGILAGNEGRFATHPIMSLIPFANKELLDEQLEALKKAASSPQGLFSNTLNDTKEEIKRLALGEHFLKWLRSRISMGKIPINQSDKASVLRIENGILISRALLEKFSKENNLDAQLVEKQFHQVVALAGSFGGVTQAKSEQWLWANNPALVFGGSVGRGIPPIYKGNINPLSTAQLNPSNLSPKA